MAGDVLLRAFRFRVTLLRDNNVAGAEAATAGTDSPKLGDGGFQECAGLEIEQDVRELLEGGRNDGVLRQVGRAKYPTIVLKRGMFLGTNGTVNLELWTWIQSIVSGVRPVARYDGRIEVFRTGFETAAVWHFDRGLPARIRGPELNARTGEIAIEELHIAHERLQLVRG